MKQTLTKIPEDFNWKKIVKTLRKQGFSYVEIAKRTGFSPQIILRLEEEVYAPEWIPIIKLLDLYHDAGNNLETVAQYEDAQSC